MTLEFRPYFSTERKKYRVLPVEVDKQYAGKIFCSNCRKFIYNRFTRGPFCAKHLTPIKWYEACAYFIPTWDKKL